MSHKFVSSVSLKTSINTYSIIYCEKCGLVVWDGAGSQNDQTRQQSERNEPCVDQPKSETSK